MTIVEDNLTGSQIIAFLEDHLKDMHRISPPGSVHALALDRLRAPGISFWSAWMNEKLVGCCALKALGENHAEIKSMRVAPSERGRGIGGLLLEHALDQAARKGFDRISLETGSHDFFLPARRLYARWGFESCEPFADYGPDPNSCFFTRLVLRPVR